jgi:hypothetical protein
MYIKKVSSKLEMDTPILIFLTSGAGAAAPGAAAGCGAGLAHPVMNKARQNTNANTRAIVLFVVIKIPP